MPENLKNFYYQDESGEKIPLKRMSRAMCEEVIQIMAEELAYWHRLDAMVSAIVSDEDASGATIQ